MRLIDADALKKHKQLEPFGNGKYEYIDVVYADDIDTAPIIDAVPVVRCKDCKHRAEWNGAYGCDLDSCFGDRYTDGFCDRAERKDDE